MVEYMADATTLPILLDADTGYGGFLLMLLCCIYHDGGGLLALLLLMLPLL